MCCCALTLRISELVEKETEEYHKADPDPFDDRHPGMKRKDRNLEEMVARFSGISSVVFVFDISLLATRESWSWMCVGAPAEDPLQEWWLHEHCENGWTDWRLFSDKTFSVSHKVIYVFFFFFSVLLSSWWTAMWWPAENFPSMQQLAACSRTSCLDWRRLLSFRKRWVISDVMITAKPEQNLPVVKCVHILQPVDIQVFP